MDLLATWFDFEQSVGVESLHDPALVGLQRDRSAIGIAFRAAKTVASSDQRRS
jgi:hypothetical protein